MQHNAQSLFTLAERKEKVIYSSRESFFSFIYFRFRFLNRTDK